MVDAIGKNDQTLATNSVGPTASSGAVTKTEGKTSDSIGKSANSAGSDKNSVSDSPELQAAQYILWFNANNQLSIQNYGSSGGSGKGTSQSIEAVNPALFKLQLQNDMNAIVLSVLDAWSKSIHQNAQAQNRDENSERHRIELESTDRAGHEAYLATLTPDQKTNMIESNRLTSVGVSVGKTNEGFAQGLDDILSKAKAGDPTFSAAVPFIAGAAVAIGATETNPINTAVGSIVAQVAPSYSVDLSTLSNLYVNLSINVATAQTIASSPGSKNQKIDYDFAKNYAQQILKEVNSSDFNSWAMAIVTHKTEGGAAVDEKSLKGAVAKLKIAMLSTALALLYQMETSYQGKGGGITGGEFVALINGEIPVGQEDPKSSLITQIRGLLESPLSQNESDHILATVSSWIDNSSKGLSLTKVSPLFDAMRATPDLAINSFAF
jgi:hypothetical protein